MHSLSMIYVHGMRSLKYSKLSFLVIAKMEKVKILGKYSSVSAVSFAEREVYKSSHKNELRTNEAVQILFCSRSYLSGTPAT